LLLGCAALVHDFSSFSAARAQGALPADPAAAAAPADEDHGGGHADPVAPVLAGIVLILLAAKAGGDLFERVGLPAVLGELVVGILLGNCALLTGWHGLDFLKAPRPETLPSAIQKLEANDEAALTPEERTVLAEPARQSVYQTGAILRILASIGVILLLFEVGLESTVGQMMSVGVSSLLVALLGVIAPMALGYLVGIWLIPEEGWQVHAFIGATLCATSVGITARVLKDLGRSQQRESQIILGAAVIDDVLGLIVLAVVSGVIQQGTIEPLGLLKIIGLAFGFLAGAIFLGTRLLARPLFKAASLLRGHGLLVVTALVICFGFSYLANVMGLAPIVGAFAAGLILEHAHYRELGAQEDKELEEAIAPIAQLLVPIFFVSMGMDVDLASFADPSVWSLAAAITVAAVLGKQVCSFGVTERGLNRLAIGLGMIPRGEVGLIFADQGRKLVANGHPVVEPGTYSAVVVMVILTTMVTPPLLKWAMLRGDRKA
jgi:Kef-type K+ transport system membrane component KefB